MSPQILVIESYADLRAGIVAALEHYAYSCDAVASAEAAVLKLREHDYAYVVLDVDAASPQATREFVSALGEANVILISDSDPREPHSEHVAMLRKPFSRDELMAQLRSIPVC
ncbi:MAG TPA: hypothetical protein VE010_16495 [Thermoanaerobaculia bacterium]|nr:hypothetical protein [Thermoanaerobaculia bacterium]